MEEKISIVLPTYNGEKNISKSIESVLSQTYKNWELIIINDCSTDNTLDIISAYTCKDARITVISNEVNKKLPASLNVGFSLASGELLTWTSDDNAYHENALETMVNVLKASDNIDMVYADFNVVNTKGELMWHANKPEPEEIVYDNIVGACFLYKKTLANAIGWYDTELFLAEDYEYWIRAFLNGNLKHIDEILYDYVWHDKSLTVTKEREVYHKTFEAKDKHFDELLARCNTQEARNRFYWSMLKLLLDDKEKATIRKEYYLQDREFMKADKPKARKERFEKTLCAKALRRLKVMK